MKRKIVTDAGESKPMGIVVSDEGAGLQPFAAANVVVGRDVDSRSHYAAQLCQDKKLTIFTYSTQFYIPPPPASNYKRNGISGQKEKN